MSSAERRQIAVCTSYDDLIRALRERADELKVTRECIDAVSGIQAGYAGKLLSMPPIRTFGRVSLGPMLQALGLTLIVAEDPEALQRFASQRAERQRPMHKGGKHQVIKFQITRARLAKLGRRGGQKRAANLTARQRHRIAKKAAQARWGKSRNSVVARMSAFGGKADMPFCTAHVRL